jgi:asparagine synthase (glutamine-hydrolysing)
VGIIDASAATSEVELGTAVQRATEALAHRGPDHLGQWVDASVGVALGHARLSIIDVSAAGHQPMVSRGGGQVLVYNGELYNHGDLRKRLQSRGVAFEGTSDTEVLLAAISEWGLRPTLQLANGMFALAVWDRATRKLWLARDRFGEKPLYFGWAGRTFLFASELKALTTHPAFVGEIDRDALALYFRHNYIPAPRSIYRGVRKLLPGTMAEARPTDVGRVRFHTYWSARDAAKDARAHPLDITTREAADQLEHLIRDSVSRRMMADVPLGAFLSGGIDSSMIVAAMQAQSAAPVQTFTIGFSEHGFDEAVHARAVAQHLGTDHHELYVSPEEAVAVVPDLPTIYDEPFADSSQIPTWVVSKLAAGKVKVALSGDGGDELFGGYTRYFVHRDAWRRLRRVPPSMRSTLGRAVRTVPTAAWDRALGLVGWGLPSRLRVRDPGHKLHRLASLVGTATAETIYLSLVSHWEQPAEVVVGAREPGTILSDSTTWPAGFSDTERLMWLDTVTYLPDDILTKVDRASMAHSLEVRVPMLDHRLYAFAWSLPPQLRTAGKDSKVLLREVLGRYVPAAYFDRPKMGFGVPLGDWLRTELRDWAETLLARQRLQDGGLLHPDIVRRRWNEHVTGVADWKYQLWDVLVFQSWLAARGATGTAG